MDKTEEGNVPETRPKNIIKLIGFQGVKKVTLKLNNIVIYEGPGDFAEKDFELPEVNSGREAEVK